LELRDLIVTPIILILVFWGAYIVRPWVTDEVTRRYFMPALAIRVFCAIALGLLYQFYYGGGDTFSYHTWGSRFVWEAFMESPSKGLQLLFGNANEHAGNTFKYSSQILFFSDPGSYFIVRIAAFFDLITFSSYSATAILFSVFSFIGMWMLYLTFYEIYPHLYRWLAIAILFIPSVCFWGSGLLKDTVTLAGLGFLTFSIYNIFIVKRYSFKSIVLFLVSIFLIFSIKKYILLCFLPAALLWAQMGRLALIKSQVVRILVIPFVFIMIFISSYFALEWVGKGDEKYSLDRLARTAQITAYDIAYFTGRGAGSFYSIGELDGTFSGMVKLAPQAINVSLFRPYLWEVRNPLMLLSAVESFLLLGLTLFVFYKRRTVVIEALRNPDILFCMVFSITFAFAVGVSTFNFGTLTRYKIPLLPFYLIGLILMLNYSKEEDSVI
jgi:hypothetical protein